MATTIKVKSRIGSSGAPSTLKTGEIAYNHTDDIFYIGKGDDGGDATSIQEIAGANFAKLASPALTGTPFSRTRNQRYRYRPPVNRVGSISTLPVAIPAESLNAFH